MTRAVLVLLLLAGCARSGGQQSPESVTDRATIAACREQANRAFNEQNRDQIYQIYQPYAFQSSVGLTGNPTQSLSDRYSLEQSIQNCIRNTGTGADRQVTGGAVPAAPSLTH